MGQAAASGRRPGRWRSLPAAGGPLGARASCGWPGSRGGCRPRRTPSPGNTGRSVGSRFTARMRTMFGCCIDMPDLALPLEQLDLPAVFGPPLAQHLDGDHLARSAGRPPGTPGRSCRRRSGTGAGSRPGSSRRVSPLSSLLACQRGQVPFRSQGAQAAGRPARSGIPARPRRPSTGRRSRGRDAGRVGRSRRHRGLTCYHRKGPECGGHNLLTLPVASGAFNGRFPPATGGAYPCSPESVHRRDIRTRRESCVYLQVGVRFL